jgi:curli production protein
MNADADIQVWLETAARTNPEIIVPYVRTAASKTLRYDVRTVQEGANGRSNMAQSGAVTVQANVATPLVRMSVTRSRQDYCHIEIVITEGHSTRQDYHFECPAPGTERPDG